MDYRRHTWRSTRILWGRSSVHRHWGFLYSQGKEDKLGRTDQVAALLSAARRLTIHSSRRCFATRLNSGVSPQCASYGLLAPSRILAAQLAYQQREQLRAR